MANVDAPTRAGDLEMLGSMVGSGYRTPPSLVRRPDGQTFQLTPLLYAILDAIDGRRGYSEIAGIVSYETGRTVAPADVETLIDAQLRPRGLVLNGDGTLATARRSNPLTGLKLKVAVTDADLTRRLTDPFTVFFHPWVWLPLLLAFGWVAWWLLVDHGLASATYHAFAKPQLLTLVVVITILSAGFHEFGHAAAARRGGAQPGAMGAGLYLLWPAFYTDVTDTYRLGRAARVRTDLGGLYFNAIVAVAITAIWWISGWDALLLVVVAQILQMVRQLAPLVRFDGYHVLADLTGVPDLFSRIGPILASFWPTRWHDPRVSGLRWWARLLVTAWVVIVVPVLLVSLLAMVVATPRLIGTAWESLIREAGQAAQHWGGGQYLDATGATLAMGAIALPILAMFLIFRRVATRFVGGLWRRTDGRPVRRAGAGLLLATMAAALALAWWPNAERYRPVMPYEGGTLVDLASVPLAAAGLAPPSEEHDRGGELVTVLPASEPMPTEAQPQLALVLVPDDSSTPSGEGTSVGSAPSAAGWVFPFNEPLPPEAGDNQALAVNTTDGSATYDVAVAMVWVTDDDPVLNVNEAYAFASCADCVTVAVAFQVVVIVGSADVIVPQNLSAAVNYECFACITAAIASQLVVTVDALPDAEQQVALLDVWDEITAFASSIPTLPLADVIARLEEYKSEIATILELAPLSTSSSLARPSASPTVAPGVPAAAPSATDPADAAPGASVPPPSPSPTGQISASAQPSASSTPTPSSSSPAASSSSEASPTPTASPSAEPEAS